MCELLVRVVDKVSNDPYLDAKLTKRGDVVCVQPDGWVWGKEEQLNPDWRIFRVPGVKRIDALGFEAPELDTDPAQPSRTLQKRAFYLDIDDPVLADAFAGWLDDARRSVPMRRFDLTIEQLLQLKKAKPPIDDPNVFD